MNISKKVALTAVVGFGMSSAAAMAGHDWAAPGSTVVKCKGIAAKGGNDCGANDHDCGGKAKVDRDPNEWVYLPKGVCEKIAGGVVWKEKTVAGKKTDKKKT